MTQLNQVILLKQGTQMTHALNQVAKVTHQAITGYQVNQVNQVMQPKQGTQVSQQATVHRQRRDRRGPNFLLTILIYYVTVSALLLTPILFHFSKGKILQ